jgi:purine-binding chemotaxis protein CheW
MDMKSYIVFALDDQQYALSVQSVKTVIRSAALTYLPEAPDPVLGLLNIGGTFIPVINIREQFFLPQKPISVSDRIIIAEASTYTIAFIADSVEDVLELAQEPLDQSVDIYPGMEDFLAGVARYNEHNILIYDINTLFPEQTIKQINDEIEQIKEPAC